MSSVCIAADSVVVGVEALGSPSGQWRDWKTSWAAGSGQRQACRRPIQAAEDPHLAGRSEEDDRGAGARGPALGHVPVRQRGGQRNLHQKA
jgi:hypothetical protein